MDATSDDTLSVRVESEPRLRFLTSEKKRQVELTCRLPGCNETFVRERQQGRAKWFHEPSCSRKFAQRQQALDEVIDEWATRLGNPDSPSLTWRQRTALEWELRWLISVRTQYVGPRDWLDGIPETRAQGPGPDLARLLQAWRQRNRRLSGSPDPCPVCQGSGDFSEFRRPFGFSLSEHPALRTRFTRSVAAEALIALRRLTVLRMTLITDPNVSGVLDLLERIRPDVHVDFSDPRKVAMDEA